MSFIGRVALEPIEEAGLFSRGRWRTLENLVFRSTRHNLIISVPVGFETDLASVPRWLPITNMLAGGTAIKAAVFHDYLYHHPAYYNDVRRMVPRQICDDVFDEIMEAEHVPGWRKSLMWAGVRVGGWLSYGENAR